MNDALDTARRILSGGTYTDEEAQLVARFAVGLANGLIGLVAEQETEASLVFATLKRREPNP